MRKHSRTNLIICKIDSLKVIALLRGLLGVCVDLLYLIFGKKNYPLFFAHDTLPCCFYPPPKSKFFRKLKLKASNSILMASLTRWQDFLIQSRWLVNLIFVG